MEISPDSRPVANAMFKEAYLRAGEHVVIIPIPDVLLLLIGLVAIHWSTFEIELDRLIEALYEGGGMKPPEGWKFRPFIKRKKLFLDLVTGRFQQAFPLLSQQYVKIASQAANLHWRRNTLLHGSQRAHFPAGIDGTASFWAESIHNGKQTKIMLDEPTLEAIWHDIAHLTGNLIATVEAHSDRVGWPFSLPSTDLIRAHREGKPLIVPIQENMRHRPLPFQE